jgi:hypothetical protein
MDLASFSIANPPVAIELLNPDTLAVVIGDDDNPVTFMMISYDHPEYRKWQHAKRDKAAAVAVRKAQTAASEEAEFTENLAAVVKGWSDNWSLDGKKLPYTPENALRILSDERFVHIARQLHARAVTTANFVKASA